MVLWLDVKTNQTRRRSFFVTAATLFVSLDYVIPMLMYKCRWLSMPSLKVLRSFYGRFFFIMAVAVYCIASIILLVSFSYRIRRYGTENDSRIKTFGKYLNTHLFIFVPPITFTAFQAPYSIVYLFKDPRMSYFPCSISLEKFIAKFFA